MHGSPISRTLIVVVVLMFTAFPLWKLTHPALVHVPVVSAAAAAKIKLEIGLTFVKAPIQFQLLHLGKVIWESQSPADTESKAFDLEFPKEGIDLEIKATWPEGTQVSAVQVSVAPGVRDPIQKSAWGQASLDEVLTFQ